MVNWFIVLTDYYETKNLLEKIKLIYNLETVKFMNIHYGLSNNLNHPNC